MIRVALGIILHQNDTIMDTIVQRKGMIRPDHDADCLQALYAAPMATDTTNSTLASQRQRWCVRHGL